MKYFIPAICVLLLATSCQKELYFDREPVLTDTLPGTPVFSFPACASCTANAELNVNEWSFRTKTSYLCGTLTDGIITSNKNAFTFFGPSACSIDSGMVITAYLDPARINGDTTNFHASYVAFYYYDHTTTDYILVSKRNTAFSLTITDYKESSGIASGTFSGGSFLVNGAFIYVDEGRFKVRLRK